LPRAREGGAFGFDHVLRHPQSDVAVDTATAFGLLGVVVLDGDLVAEEPRRPGAGVGDQCFLPGQFQLEVVMQECGQALLDLLGLGPWSGEPQEVVVRIRM
jgi:hypothetical protein